MITKQKIIYLLSVFSFMSVGWGCIDDVEVELWGECYNIQTTTTLNLYHNQLTGEIPPEIGNLTNLGSLDLSSNQLTGEIPSEIGNLTNLSGWYLNNNQLSGEIPSEIWEMTNLHTLSLSDNQLTGEIPPEIGDLTNLHHLYLGDNQLTGEIPVEICNIEDLMENYSFPRLENNQFCPPYPECLSEQNVGDQDTSECVEYQLGDVNMDEVINILDIVKGVNIILDIIPSTEYELFLLDFNEDGETDILDIVGIVDYVLNNN